MKRTALIGIVFVVCTAVAVLFLLNKGAADDRTLLTVAGMTKLASLVIAAIFSIRSAHLLGKGNPARMPWFILGAGLTAMSLGQALLLFYQFTTGKSPFPSPADFWFVLSYPLIIFALVQFALTYTRSGFSSGNLKIFAVVIFIVAAAVAWPILQPVAHMRAAPMEKALNLAYPSLDLLLMVPIAVLLRITSRFRGGAVWPIWLSLLVGFVFTAAGDILFAYLSALGHNELDPLIHATFIIAYGNLAWGALFQERLLTA
jgi:hypothetical protein